MMTAAYFAVGDVFSCEYNGKPRPRCEVVEMITGRDWMVVKTDAGIRRFKYHKVCEMKTLYLSPA